MTSILNVAGSLEAFIRNIDYIKGNIPAVKESYQTHVLSVDSSFVFKTSSGLPFVF